MHKGLKAEEGGENPRALGIEVVSEIAGVDPRVGGQPVLVEDLEDGERAGGGIAIAFVGVDLQGAEVIEPGRTLGALLTLAAPDDERLAGDLLYQSVGIGLLHDPAGVGGEEGATVVGDEAPVVLRLEIAYGLVAADDIGQRRGLHTADADDGALAAELQGVEAGTGHAEEPVGLGTGETGLVKVVKLLLQVEVLKAVLDGLVGERGDPEAFDGKALAVLDTCQLLDPALDDLALLAGIATVDDLIGGDEEPADDFELLLDTRVVDEPDLELLRDDGERGKAPVFKAVVVVLRGIELTEVAEGPGDLVAVALHVAVMFMGGAEDAGDGSARAGFFCNANFHCWSKFRGTGASIACK